MGPGAHTRRISARCPPDGPLTPSPPHGAGAQVRSLAHVPEQITGTWAIWNSSDKIWLDAADLHIQADTSFRAAAERVANEPLPLPKALPSPAGEEALMVVRRRGKWEAPRRDCAGGEPEWRARVGNRDGEAGWGTWVVRQGGEPTRRDAWLTICPRVCCAPRW